MLASCRFILVPWKMTLFFDRDCIESAHLAYVFGNSVPRRGSNGQRVPLPTKTGERNALTCPMILAGSQDQAGHRALTEQHRTIFQHLLHLQVKGHPRDHLSQSLDQHRVWQEIQREQGLTRWNNTHHSFPFGNMLPYGGHFQHSALETLWR